MAAAAAAAASGANKDLRGRMDLGTALRDVLKFFKTRPKDP